MPNITVSEDVHSLLQAGDNAAVRDSIGLNPTHSLAAKRSTSISFEDLGFVEYFSENAGGNMNGYPFDTTPASFTTQLVANIQVWNPFSPEDSGQAPADFRYFWMPDTEGFATDLRWYDKLASNPMLPHADSSDFLSPSQSFSISNVESKRITPTHRGDYLIPQGYDNKVAVATMDLEAGRDHYLEYEILCFYAQGGPSFSPEFLLTSETAGMDLTLSIESVNATTINDTATEWRGNWNARSWDVSAASNYNSEYNLFGTIEPEMGFANGACYSIKYSVKAKMNCTESTTCTLNYYNTSGAKDGLVDVMFFKFE